MTERKPHKWSEVIKAWADGKPIQFRIKNGAFWVNVEFDGGIPLFNDPKLEFRLKPENVVVEENVYILKTITDHGIKGRLEIANGGSPNIRLEFDPETYILVKAEVIGEVSN